MKLKLLLISLAFLAIFSSCSKENKGNKELKFNTKVIDTRDYTKWTYFSFEKGIIGTYTESEFDYKNNLSWDIAFHRWDIRTNSGLSGKGKGGALETKFKNLSGKEWGDAKSLGGFASDVMIKTYMSAPDMKEEGGKDQRVEVPANAVIGKWLNVTMSMPPKREINKNVFIVKTADGKFAAIQFTNYMNEKAESGYVNFNYIYPLD